MKKRVKKSPVEIEKRRGWLRREEENGETPVQIAKDTNYDIRTVRANLQKAREERAAREARTQVIRNALELHYADLVAFAEKLESALVNHAIIPLPERDDRLFNALREHLPRSPIWTTLNRWEYLITEIRRLEESVKTRLHEQLERHSGEGICLEGLLGAIIEYMKSIVRSPDIQISEGSFNIQQRSDNQIEISYNCYTCGIASPDRENEIIRFIIDLMKQASRWPESDSIGRIMNELPRVTENLREELATIRLRRIIPGRCRYCPL